MNHDIFFANISSFDPVQNTKAVGSSPKGSVNGDEAASPLVSTTFLAATYGVIL